MKGSRISDSVWPSIYVLVFFPALLLMTRLPRRAWLAALAAAAVVQAVETWPMRQLATVYSQKTEPDVLDQARFDTWLDGHDREATEARSLQLADRTLYVFSADAVAKVPRLGEQAATPACRREPWGVVCSTNWSH